MARAQTAQQTKITRSDLESKFRAFQGDIQGKVDDKKQTLLAGGAGIDDVPAPRVLPPRTPQRQEEDDAGRDPPGLTDGNPPTRALSPSVLIRRRALQRGVFGSSPMWRAVAVVVFGRRFLKRVFGKTPRGPRHRTAEGRSARADRGHRPADPA